MTKDKLLTNTGLSNEVVAIKDMMNIYISESFTNMGDFIMNAFELIEAHKMYEKICLLGINVKDTVLEIMLDIIHMIHPTNLSNSTFSEVLAVEISDRVDAVIL